MSLWSVSKNMGVITIHAPTYTWTTSGATIVELLCTPKQGGFNGVNMYVTREL